MKPGLGGPERLFYALLVYLMLMTECAGATLDTEKTSPPPGTKSCALTFDDGPDAEKTARVLDKLDHHGIRATFFWIGQKVTEANRTIMERLVAGGHEVGNHSWDHQTMNRMSAEEIRASVEKTSAAILSYTDKPPRFFRAPSLATSALMYETIPYPFMGGGVIAKDWEPRWGGLPGAEERAARVLEGIQDGAIILMHDAQPDPHPTPEALDIIIPALIQKGYRFVTLSELFKRRNVSPQAGTEIQWAVVK